MMPVEMTDHLLRWRRMGGELPRAGRIVTVIAAVAVALGIVISASMPAWSIVDVALFTGG